MKFYIHRLGCPKNDVDADYIAARLAADGHEAVSDPEQAETILVNTCGFILPAKEESIEELLRLSQLKKEGKLKSIYATGCLTQRYGTELLDGLPEVDGAFGLGELDAIAAGIGGSERSEGVVMTESRNLTYLAGKSRFISDDLPYAYLKISDGCNRTCSYCVIPQIRGSFRSRSVEELTAEARFLVANGKKELILVSQDTTLYGRDLRPRRPLIDLLRELETIEDAEWIRPMYLHPASVDMELLEYMASPENKVLDYFDLPLQHVNTEVLAAMGRPSTRDQIERLIDAIRERAPGATLRTTFIVGFPGETEEQFQELYDFAYRHEFERLSCFTYSAEEGSSAAEMSGQVPEEEKYRRLDELMNLQQEIAFTRNSSLIGSVQEVILDRLGDEGGAVGRTRGDCPDIDQEVIVDGEDLQAGDIRRVRIDAADGYDLRGVCDDEEG